MKIQKNRMEEKEKINTDRYWKVLLYSTRMNVTWFEIYFNKEMLTILSAICEINKLSVFK